MKYFIFICFVFFLAKESIAHSGGLNAQGCHNNHKTGGYHCHRSQGATPSNPLNTNLKCTITIGNQYFEFNPSALPNTTLQFEDKSGKVNIKCN